ncbi:MAG: hypothetical protein ABIX01_08810 [Chitinophagaceae bacterium]
MKTNILNNRKAAMLIAAAFVISSLPFANAKAGEKVSTSTVAVNEAKPGISTRYLGEKDAQVFIRIALNQPTEQKSFLRIYDESGVLLYEEMVTSKNQAKVIKVSPDELSSLQIVYSAGKAEAKKLVVINTVEARRYEIAEVTKF